MGDKREMRERREQRVKRDIFKIVESAIVLAFGLTTIFKLWQMGGSSTWPFVFMVFYLSSRCFDLVLDK